MTARNCPHCSAPERGDGRPACLCAAVGADDFDPLRVRPYVSLPDGEEGAGEDAGRGSGGDDRRGDGGDDGGVGGAGAGAVGVAGPGAAGAGGAAAGAGDQLDDLPGADAAVYRADASASTALSNPSDPSALSSSGPLIPQARRRSGPTSRTFTAADGEPSAGPADPARPVPRRTRPRPAALVATGAAAAVAAALIGTDALSGGVRDRAAPPDRSTASPAPPSPPATPPHRARPPPPPPRAAPRHPTRPPPARPRPPCGATGPGLRVPPPPPGRPAASPNPPTARPRPPVPHPPGRWSCARAPPGQRWRNSSNGCSSSACTRARQTAAMTRRYGPRSRATSGNTG